jgi:hypothetical protein
VSCVAGSGTARRPIRLTVGHPQLNGAYIDESDEEEIFGIVTAVATRELDDVRAITARLAPLVRPLHPAQQICM